MRYRVSKYIKKSILTICFKCGKTGHLANICCNKPICIIFSSTDHTKADFPEKDDATREKFKCPNCDLNYPATYAGCSFYKEKMQRKIEYSKQREQKSTVPTTNEDRRTFPVVSNNPWSTKALKNKD